MRENQVIEAVTLAGSAEDLDFSIWALFLRADPIVKSVIVLLLGASVWCWAIIIDKVIGLRRLSARSTEFEQAFWSGNSLDELYERIASQPRDPIPAFFAAAIRDWRRTPAAGGPGAERYRGSELPRERSATGPVWPVAAQSGPVQCARRRSATSERWRWKLGCKGGFPMAIRCSSSR